MIPLRSVKLEIGNERSHNSNIKRLNFKLQILLDLKLRKSKRSINSTTPIEKEVTLLQ
jgi:hypothetical protein